MTATMNHIEQEFKALEASVVGDSGVFESGIGVAAEKISEVVGSPAENQSIGASGAFSDEDKKGLLALLDFGAVSDRINALVRSNRPKIKKMPSPEKQAKLVKKSLEKEQAHLLKQAKKIQNSRQFSAAKLEQVLLQVRHIQKLLKEIVTAARDRIEFLYQKYVLKVA